MGILFAFLSALAFSFSNVMIKKGQRKSGANNGFLTTVVLNVIILSFVFLLSLLQRGFTFVFSYQALFWFITAGLFTTGLGRYSLFSGIRRIGPSRASAIKNSAPFFTVLFALFFLGETVSIGGIIGILLLVGAIFIQGVVIFLSMNKREVVPEASGGQAALKKHIHNSDGNVQWVGYLLVVLAAICFGVGQGFRKQGLNLMDDAFFGALTGALTALIFFLAFEGVKGNLRATLQANFQRINLFFVAAGVLSSLGPLFFFIAATYTQVSYVSVIAGAEPFMTILVSALLMRGEEKLTFSVYLTIFMVTAGTVIIALTG